MTYPPEPCDWPPFGWYCTRTWGHGGPCAAKPYWWMKLWMFVQSIAKTN